MRQPSITTDRLVLRPFQASDARDVERIVGAFEIADMTRSIPHPYPPGLAAQWIASLAPRYQDGTQATFAITSREGGGLIGAIGLVIAPADQHAELGYWLDLPFWGQGYMTEAATAMLRFGFKELGLERIYATHLARNPASGRVMQKIGMRYEGCLRGHVRKRERFEDVAQYGLLRAEWQAGAHTARVSGVNHLTLAVRDVPRSLAFYRDVLGMRPVAAWPRGAYLLAGDTWVALVADQAARTAPLPEYTHIALSVAPASFEKLSAIIQAAGAPIWQANRSEGESLYFLDPDGHKLEIHSSDLAARLRAARANPWEGLVILE
jgi:ribosomal-protein-alanine N-acetyltransferase